MSTDFGVKILITAEVAVDKVWACDIEAWALSEPDSPDLMVVALVDPKAPDSVGPLLRDPCCTILPERDENKAFLARQLYAEARDKINVERLREAYIERFPERGEHSDKEEHNTYWGHP